MTEHYTHTIESQPIADTPSSNALDNAPDEIKLAVDLIYLLESNNVDNDVAIKALEIVLSDFKKK